MNTQKTVATSALAFLTYKIGEASMLNQSLRAQQAALETTDNQIDRGLLIQTAHLMAHTMRLFLETQQRWWAEKQRNSTILNDSIAWTARNLEFAATLTLQIEFDLHVVKMTPQCPIAAARMMEFFQRRQATLGRHRATWFELKQTLSVNAFREMQGESDEHGQIILTLERVQGGLDDAASLHHRCEESLIQLLRTAPEAGKKKLLAEEITERVRLEQAFGYLKSAASHTVRAEMHMHHLKPAST